MAATIFINVTSFSMLYILAPQLTRQLVGGDDAEASRVFGTMLTVQSLLNMFRFVCVCVSTHPMIMSSATKAQIIVVTNQNIMCLSTSQRTDAGQAE